VAYTLNRIGKSLVKFFRPVRVALPHHPETGDSSRKREDLRKGFRLFTGKRPEDEALKQEITSAATPSETEVAELPPVPEKPPASWLELVEFLLTTCRRLSDRMRRKVGLETYRNAVQWRGQHRLKAIGSIVDTTTIVSGDDEEAA
jgi:hypothetical protein